jgi:ribosomal protein L11 methylase PrmA
MEVAMLSKRSLMLLSLPLSAAAMLAVAPIQPAHTQPPRLDVPFVPTPEPVVEKMLDLAKVGPNDVVYDLGSGDGRIVILAAQRGARAVGVDLDPQRVREARANAQRANVGDRAEFRQGNLFDVNLAPATVVTLYLLPGVNLKLKPKLLKELRPGTRIVSHSFDMGDWKPARSVEVDGRKVHLWIVPERGGS